MNRTSERFDMVSIDILNECSKNMEENMAKSGYDGSREVNLSKDRVKNR